jgi:hypothetical protein
MRALVDREIRAATQRMPKIARAIWGAPSLAEAHCPGDQRWIP